MKKLLCIILCMFILVTATSAIFAEEPTGNITDISFYVDGVTDGVGTIERPYKTLEEARNAARALRDNGIETHVTVYIRGGEYYRDSQFALEEKDRNITFRNYPGEDVLITGGRKVAKEHITKVADKAILQKIIDPMARKRLYQIDLSEYVDALEYPYEWSSALVGWDETMFARYLRVVVNGSGLDKSRWPNTTEAELVTQNMSNPDQGIATFRYDDYSERAKLWSAESIENLMVRGHFQYHWTHNLQYATVDPGTKTVTTRNATKGKWENGRSFYFMNLMEEIDMPGESYTDVENRIVYFYGYGDMENPEVYVPTAENRLVSIVKSKNLTIQGINFAHSKSKLIDCYGGSYITVDDCDFTHFGGRNYFYGDHITVKNCYFYGNAVTMVDTRDYDGVYPGNSSVILKRGSAGNVFENNKFNLGNEVNLYSSTALASTVSKGMIVKNNEIYNSSGSALGLGASIDAVIEKNHFHDCVQWTGDMGVIYWHSNAASFGHEIRYNFFENNGSVYCDGWAQSIFNDCSSTGAWIHHNVFNQGTLGTSEGGQKFAIKSFGGQFSMIENNVFIDTPYAAQFQTWYPFEADGRQTG